MAIDQVHNESLKLSANLANGVAIALIAGGVILPMVSFYTGAQNTIQPDAILLVICATMGLILHRLGQWFVGGLESD